MMDLPELPHCNIPEVAARWAKKFNQAVTVSNVVTYIDNGMLQAFVKHDAIEYPILPAKIDGDHYVRSHHRQWDEKFHQMLPPMGEPESDRLRVTSFSLEEVLVYKEELQRFEQNCLKSEPVPATSFENNSAIGQTSQICGHDQASGFEELTQSDKNTKKQWRLEVNAYIKDKRGTLGADQMLAALDQWEATKKAGVEFIHDLLWPGKKGNSPGTKQNELTNARKRNKSRGKQTGE